MTAPSPTSKVWFITGTSKGFGRIWAEAALQRGDRVVATARDVRSLASLVAEYSAQVLTLSLDVTDQVQVEAAVKQGHAHFGRLDVVVNNAGYGLFGSIEEVSAAEARAVMETNFFGALWVTKAALPYLREQRSGHIVGMYNASKWALEGFSQSLAAEVHDFGIKVTLTEPTGYETDWGPSAVQARKLPFYDGIRARLAGMLGSVRRMRGKPLATGPAMLKLVDAEEPPLRVFFGAGPLDMMKAEYEARLDTWQKWNELSVEAHG